MPEEKLVEFRLLGPSGYSNVIPDSLLPCQCLTCLDHGRPTDIASSALMLHALVFHKAEKIAVYATSARLYPIDEVRERTGYSEDSLSGRAATGNG